MICPYCQHELDVETAACPRCHAAYPRPGRPLGFTLRTAIAGASMMLVMSMILVDCVAHYLPGGIDSSIPTGSAQLPTQPLPNMKSPAVNALLNSWANGQQNGTSPVGAKKL